MENDAQSSWFLVKKIQSNLFLVTEPFFYEGNRCNIWLLRGGHSDLIVDCGLGVSNLRKFLEGHLLLDPVDKPNARPCLVVCTHVHFDHSGGASNFETVYIHNEEAASLRDANSIHTLNWVKNEHFDKYPSHDFDVSKYCVKKTKCNILKDGDILIIGDDEHVEVMHLPGHSSGSIALHYPLGKSVFVGDIVYECGHGSGLLDWLPSSSVNQYTRSCARLHAFLESSMIENVYPGHFAILTPKRTKKLLLEYIDDKQSVLSRGFAKCLRMFATLYFRCR